MEKNPLIAKALVIGIILLFVGIAYAPVICAQDDTIISKTFSIPKKEDTVSITVREYKADGTIGKSVVKMTQEQERGFRAELKSVKDMDTRLSIYKKYHLIPQDVTDEKLRLGMEEKARRFGPEIEMLQNYMTNLKSNNFLSEHFCMNFFCRVDTFVVGSLRFLCGSSFITSVLNNYISPILPSIDLFQIIVGFGGGLGTTNGILPDSFIFGFAIAFFIFGFVGYYISQSWAPTFFISEIDLSLGYAVASLGFTAFPWYYDPYYP